MVTLARQDALRSVPSTCRCCLQSMSTPARSSPESGRARTLPPRFQFCRRGKCRKAVAKTSKASSSTRARALASGLSSCRCVEQVLRMLLLRAWYDGQIGRPRREKVVMGLQAAEKKKPPPSDQRERPQRSPPRQAKKARMTARTKSETEERRRRHGRDVAGNFVLPRHCSFPARGDGGTAPAREGRSF